ncbi:MAG: Stp1/IreP family PP2C-type Ser/Thr phosphatase [Eggerthellaceae bacterium]|nr:Stp1/IreP family PP2C-type Ser/Thr phosphatase [Eggerthellaceae bacterium]
MPGRPRATPRKAKTLFGSRTDIGCIREHNEDSLIVSPPLYAVADGMGGHAAGEVASEIAVRTMAERAPDTADTAALAEAVVEANRAVIEAAHKKGRAGMGTTLTAAVLEGKRLAIAQVGDSRAYLVHQGKMQQITRDHSLMADMIEAGEITEEEARVHPKRSVITRALGTDVNLQPDLYELNVAEGDRLLLCSDGLSNMIDNDHIENILVRTADPQRAASILVNDAIAEGGHDNITVVVLDVIDKSELDPDGGARTKHLGAIVIGVVLAALIAVAALGGYAFSQQGAYLAQLDGKVAVYRGTPGSFLGIDLSHLDHVSDVNVSDLQPGVAKRLEEGTVQAESIDAANELVEQYRSDIKADVK